MGRQRLEATHWQAALAIAQRMPWLQKTLAPSGAAGAPGRGEKA
eukprot:CAMPEP_0176241560 /NCGR_PEP_ID=MMETSP0121_2-20121125/29955_1 /TAXON_ID=160619 /ORGANISM="Kryptoperidinium foliaceum, Strain CCMP 1326" /LENGTH=43 /DNA_ID= /DNA_START= /DNA_END= /DNA_ORIENTATION=